MKIRIYLLSTTDPQTGSEVSDDDGECISELLEDYSEQSRQTWQTETADIYPYDSRAEVLP